ncbi:mobile element protein [Rhodococcus wratislaviensis]|uniref:Mobile element protein n=1 Tax=Rhodococcus wratislaviensis TaxID=44752 RepID=A0A402C4E3_RHOWR|nr:mobile element protein [Rhodococcus wratislaviensis]
MAVPPNPTAKRKLTTLAAKHAPRMGARLSTEILTTPETQSVTVSGSKAAEIVLPTLADSLKEVFQQRNTIGSTDPARDRRRFRIQVRRAPRRLCRHCPGHPPIRLLHSR